MTALVEHPSVYVGEFDTEFLEVPQECLILTMRQNQKYFPLFDAAGKLTGKFLIVSNMQVADPRHIIGGNQRVVRPRLEDARFFYDQDRKTRLEERVPQLGKVVYHNKLGSQLERVERVQLLAGKIARALERRCRCWPSAPPGSPRPTCSPAWSASSRSCRASWAATTRCTTASPRQSRTRSRRTTGRASPATGLPEGPIACAVALADKLDTIAGLFGIGQQPTGDKDPFGLRRAALGVVRILVETQAAAVVCTNWSNAAFEPFKSQGAASNSMQFVYDRLPATCKEPGYSTLQIDAVLSHAARPVSTVVPQQLEAVKAFQALPEAESLAAANKRIANILKQAEAKGESFVDAALERAEGTRGTRAARGASRRRPTRPKPLYEQGDYTGYLKSFAVLKAPVDAFFDKVMVMVEDETLRQQPPRAAARPARRHEPRRRHLEARRMKLVILDRDGVINHDSDQYIKSPAEWKPIPGSLEAIARLTQGGYRVVVATNQSGIGRGLFDMATLNAIHDKMHRAVGLAGGRIDAIFFCPHAADADCDCRKPKPGLLLEIAAPLQRRALPSVPMVGDSLRDLQAAAAVGAQPIWC